MFEIRLHGRGGQGAVIASEMLAGMYFESSKYSQAFPAFGVERRGAPVMAFTRVDDDPIEIHYGVYNPDSVIVLDRSLIDIIDVSGGLKKGGTILINTDEKPAEFSQFKDFKVKTIDVNSIALSFNLGTASLPIVNTSILGAYAAVAGDIHIDVVKKVIMENAPVKQRENAEAAEKSYYTLLKNES